MPPKSKAKPPSRLPARAVASKKGTPHDPKTGKLQRAFSADDLTPVRRRSKRVAALTAERNSVSGRPTRPPQSKEGGQRLQRSNSLGENTLAVANGGASEPSEDTAGAASSTRTVPAKARNRGGKAAGNIASKHHQIQSGIDAEQQITALQRGENSPRPGDQPPKVTARPHSALPRASRHGLRSAYRQPTRTRPW